MPDEVSIAVAPVSPEDWLRAAIERGGGRLVPLPSAEALVWTEAGAPDRLGALLARHPGIRWVQLPWSGVEPFARAGLFGDGRLWTAAQGVYARPVAEHALALALAGKRDLGRFAAARRWSDQGGTVLTGSRVTVFGGGGITAELLRLLAPFDCAVTVVRRRPAPMDGAQRVLGFGDREAALTGAQLVFLALALTAETVGLIGRRELDLMDRGAWLVNVARGEHVRTGDLVDALREGAVEGAALDVTDPEPLPATHPLWRLPNCLITPHTAAPDSMVARYLSARVEENVRRYATGRPLVGVVDPALGY